MVGESGHHGRRPLHPAVPCPDGVQAQGLVDPAPGVGQPQQVQPALNEGRALGGFAYKLLRY